MRQINMQRRHFCFLAEVINSLKNEPFIDEATRKALAREFSRRLRATNSQFKPDRFLEACNAGN
jgi:hypothetical protein